MTQGSVWKLLIQFSIPMAIGLLFQQLYNTVDTIIVGRFVGKEALAAVGSTSSIINMLVGLCAGLSTGASVVISQCYGAHDYQKLSRAVHTTIAVTLVMSAVVTVVGVWIVRPMLRMMATPADVFVQAESYLTIYFAGVSGLLIYNMGSGILRAVGDSRRPLYFLCFSAIVNTGFDLLFVITFRMGVAGAAWATVLSQLLSALLVLFLLSYDHAPYGIRWKQLGIHRELLRDILSIGLPSGVQQGITSFSNVFVQSYVNYFGSAMMAGWSGYNKLDVFIVIPLQSIALASTTFVGQNYGAGNMERARRGTRQALGMSLVITATLSLGLIACAPFLLRLFTTDAQVIANGNTIIHLVAPFYVLLCFNQIFAGAMRGIGQAKVPMYIMLFSFVVFRQIYLYVNKLLGNALTPVLLAYPAGWVVCSALITIFYLRSPLCRRTKAAE